MNEILMETVIAKIEQQEKKIHEIEEKFAGQTGFTAVINQFKSAIDELTDLLKSLALPVTEMAELSDNLTATAGFLKQPVKQNVVHHHHLNKGLLISAVLFNLAVILIVFLINTKNQISENRESNIKYRHLKLTNDRNLRAVLHLTDSLYLVGPVQMEKDVMREEECRRQQFELFRQAEEKEFEARQLKGKARNK